MMESIESKEISPSYTGTLVQTKEKDRQPLAEKILLDDRSTSASSWTVSQMCKYFDFMRDVEFLDLYRDTEQNQEVGTSKHEQLSIEVFGLYEKMIKLNPLASNIGGIFNFSEADIRPVLTILLSNLANICHLGMMEEQAMDLGSFPYCRLDFLLKYKDIPIGCMEAKRSNTLNKKAFVQAVVQLVVLQNWSYKHGKHCHVDMTKVPVFNILSDGSSFIVLILNECSLYIENGGSSSNPRINIRRVTDEASFCKIFKILHHVFDDAVTHLQKQLQPSFHQSDSQTSHKICVNTGENDQMWNNFLTPLEKSESKKTKKQEDETKQDIKKDIIDGPVSLSRSFGTALSETFGVFEKDWNNIKRRKRKSENDDLKGNTPFGEPETAAIIDTKQKKKMDEDKISDTKANKSGKVCTESLKGKAFIFRNKETLEKKSRNLRPIHD